MSRSCESTRTLLCGFLDNEVTPEEREGIETHLEECEACRRELESERRLTQFLEGKRRPMIAPVRHRLTKTLTAVAAGAVVMLFAVLMFMEPSAYGSIIERKLAPDLALAEQEKRALSRSNHVDLPKGASAEIEIEGVCLIDAVGPVRFELDKIDDGWKLTLLEGRLQISRKRHGTKSTMIVVNSKGRRELGGDVYLVSADPDREDLEGRSDGVASLLQSGFEAFYKADDMKAAADRFAAAGAHEQATEAERLQAWFYLAAAQSNLGDHAAALESSARYRKSAPDPDNGVISSVRANAHWALGRREEAISIWKALLKREPDSPYRPLIEAKFREAGVVGAPESDDEGASRKRPGEGKNKTRQSSSPRRSGSPRPGEVIWSFDLKAPCYGSAAAGDVDGDQVQEIAFGTYYNDEHFYVLNAASGKQEWRKKSDGGPLDASVLIHDVNDDGKLELVWADSAYGTLFCADGEGRILWTYKGPSGTDSPPAAADLDGDGKTEIVYGTMKVRGKEGRCVVVDGATGREKWSVKVPGHVQSEPALVDLDGDAVLDVLVTNWMGDGHLRALCGKDGRELWRFKTDDWIYHGVSVFDFDGDQKPEVVVANRRGEVWMVSGESGKEFWTTRVADEAEGMVFGPTTLVQAQGDKVPEIVVCGRHVHLLDARKGEELWTRRYQGRSIARGVSVADVDGDGDADLVFGQGRTLRTIRAKDGQELWSKDLRVGDHVWEHLDNAPLIDDFDGDGFLDIFVVTGKGTSDKSRPENYGRAFLLRAGKGKAEGHRPWRTFRGGSRRLGMK